MRRLKSHLVGAIVGVLFAGVGITGAHAQEKIVWRLAYLNAPKSGFAAMVDSLPSRIAKATNGRLEIRTSSTILDPSQHLSAVKDGRVQAVTVVHPYYSAEAPILNIEGLPGTITSFEQFDRISQAFMYDAFKKLFADRYNAVLLAHGAWPGQVIWSNRPIRRVEDFKNLKVRASNVETAQLMEKLGAKPISLPFGEVISALQEGVIDAAMTSPSTGYGVGLQQMTKYLDEWPLNFTVSWSVVVNDDAWDALPDDLKPKVAAEFRAIQADYAAAVGKEYDKGMKDAAAAGVEIIKPSDAEFAKTRTPQLLTSIYDDWNARNKKQGFDGRDLLKQLQSALAH